MDEFCLYYSKVLNRSVTRLRRGLALWSHLPPHFAPARSSLVLRSVLTHLPWPAPPRRELNFVSFARSVAVLHLRPEAHSSLQSFDAHGQKYPTSNLRLLFLQHPHISNRRLLLLTTNHPPISNRRLLTQQLLINDHHRPPVDDCYGFC